MKNLNNHINNLNERINNFINLHISEKLEKVERYVELYDEYVELLQNKPVLTPSSLEDWDDNAQELLEWGWYRDEILDEMKEINSELINICSHYPYKKRQVEFPHDGFAQLVLKYEVVRSSGNYNMITEASEVMNIANINEHDYKWIIDNYINLR